MGFWEDFLKPVVSVALTVSYVIPPVAAVTIPVSALAVIGGGATYVIGKANDSETTQRVGLEVLHTVMSADGDKDSLQGSI